MTRTSGVTVHLEAFGEWLEASLHADHGKRVVIYGAPTTGKSTVFNWVKENYIVLPSLLVDSDELITSIWGASRLRTFFSTATPDEMKRYHQELRAHRVIFTNHEDYILGDAESIAFAFTRTRDTLRRELRKREEQSGRIWKASDYPWLANWHATANAILLDEGEYMSDVLEWITSVDDPVSEYNRLLKRGR